MKERKKVKILNINFDNLSMYEAIELISCDGGFVCTPNVDHLIKLQQDFEFYSIVSSADFVLCDSQIIVAISKLLGTPLKERVAGSDFFREFYLFNKKNENIRIFLLGGDSQKIVEKAKKNINKRAGREIVVGAYSPPYGFETSDELCEKIVNSINTSGATVLVVGVGAPKQEKWIWKYKDLLPNVNTFLPLGATINMEAGVLKKAPRFLSKMGLEWFFRFLQEPRRLFKRYFIDDMKFFGLIVQQMAGKYQDPFTKEGKENV